MAFRALWLQITMLGDVWGCLNYGCENGDEYVVDLEQQPPVHCKS